MIIICDYCGETYDTEDDVVCPNCGTLSRHKEEE